MNSVVVVFVAYIVAQAYDMSKSRNILFLLGNLDTFLHFYRQKTQGLPVYRSLFGRGGGGGGAGRRVFPRIGTFGGKFK